MQDIANNWKLEKIFAPEMEEKERKARLAGWKKAVQCTLVWGEQGNGG